MNISSSKPIQAMRNSPAGRAVLTALLCAFGAAALALAIFAGDTRNAQAQVSIQAGNLLLNGSFETGGSPPASWLGGALTSGDKRACNQSYAGACSFKMVGDATSKYLYQCFDFDPNTTLVGDRLKVKAWTKVKAINLGGGYAGILLTIKKTGTTISSGEISIPGGTSAWTSRQASATAAEYSYDQVCVHLYLEADSGKIWFDKVSLFHYDPL